MNFLISSARVEDVTKKTDKFYILHLIENRFEKDEDGNYQFKHAIHYNCISYFKPECQPGDIVIAEGNTIPSKNVKYPYNMLLKRIGIVHHKRNKNYIDNSDIDDEIDRNEEFN